VGTSGATGGGGAAAAAANDTAHPAGGGGDLTNGSTARPTTDSSPAGLTIMTIPSHSDTLFPLLVQRMSPLWVPRQAHRIEGGASFEMTDWKVRIGELRILAGPGQGRVRGCLCEVEFLGGGDGDQGGMEGMARAFIEGLARDSGVAVDSMKVVGPVAGEGSESVRQYMDLLRFARS
jgi:TATA-binding related factor (TRF) of subunit 20 of Mediator complex